MTLYNQKEQHITDSQFILIRSSLASFINLSIHQSFSLPYEEPKGNIEFGSNPREVWDIVIEIRGIRVKRRTQTRP